MLFRQLNTTTKVLLVLQSIAMLMGTSTHVAWAIDNGFLSSNYHAPLFSMLFWDALTFVDPLAALLLFVRPKAGLWLTLIIITADVLHNNIYYLEELYLHAPPLLEWLSTYWMIAGQLAFAVLVFATFKRNMREVNRALAAQ